MGGGGGGQHCSVLVARRQRGELATEGNEGDEREKATERDEWNGTRGENERERERVRRVEGEARRAWSRILGWKEGEGVEGRKGWLEESEDGSQALAQPVMIDWLAGSQQTDVRPPDRPTHPSRLVLHPRTPSLETPSASTAVASSPEQPRSKKLAIQCTTATLLPDRISLHLPRPLPPTKLPLFFFRGSSTPAILSYRYPFNPFSSVTLGLCCEHSCAGYVQKPADSPAIESLKVDLPGQCIGPCYLRRVKRRGEFQVAVIATFLIRVGGAGD